MLPDPVFKALLTVPMLIMALALLAIGLAVIIRKTPVLLAARSVLWLFAFMVACLAIAMISLQFSPYGSVFDIYSIFEIAMLVLVLFFLWRAMQGYMVLGVTDSAFRRELLEVLKELGQSYEETVSGFRLITLEDTLQASVQGWVGSAQFKMKSRGHQGELRAIASHLAAHLNATKGETSLLTPFVYTVMGALVGAIGVYTAFSL
jgi:hypothetical protein